MPELVLKAFIGFDERPSLNYSVPGLCKAESMLFHQKSYDHCRCSAHLRLYNLKPAVSFHTSIAVKVIELTPALQ